MSRLLKKKTGMILAVLLLFAAVLSMTGCTSQQAAEEAEIREPGMDFLEEFFHVGGDRWSSWENAVSSSDSGAAADAIDSYHEGLEPYVTAEVLERIKLGRYLSRMELLCMTEARSWEIEAISLEAKPVSGSYNYQADLRSTEEPYVYKTFTGSYLVNQDGLISNFFIDFE